MSARTNKPKEKAVRASGALKRAVRSRKGLGRATAGRPKPKFKHGEMVVVHSSRSGQRYEVRNLEWRGYTGTWHYKVNGKWRNEKDLGKRPKSGARARTVSVKKFTPKNLSMHRRSIDQVAGKLVAEGLTASTFTKTKAKKLTESVALPRFVHRIIETYPGEIKTAMAKIDKDQLSGPKKSKRTRITPRQARKMAEDLGWDFRKDFHSQGSMSNVQELLSIAKQRGYRPPRNASGSKARYFFEYLKKQ